MKPLLKSILIASLIIGAAACGDRQNKELQKKKDKLEALKKDQAEQAADIEKLEKEIARLDTSHKADEKPKLVSLDTISTESFTHYIELQGRVDALNTSYVTPRGQGGQVLAVYVKQGQSVRKGQLLAKLDDAVLRQNVAAARQGLAGTKNQLELAKNLYDRQKNLWDQHIGTEVQLLQAKTNVDVLQNQLKTQQENVRVAEEQLATANVTSPIDGVADVVNVHPGESFGPATPPANGIKIVNNGNLKVVTDVPENYLARVKQGTPVIINIADVNKTFPSTISVISQSISATSRGFTAEAKVPRDAALRANQTATIKIQDYTMPNALTVPVNTLQTDEQGKFVLVAVREGNKMIARKRQIQVGELYGDRLEVKSGLQSGDMIITEGFQSVYDGQSITTKA